MKNISMNLLLLVFVCVLILNSVGYASAGESISGAGNPIMSEEEAAFLNLSNQEDFEC